MCEVKSLFDWRHSECNFVYAWFFSSHYSENRVNTKSVIIDTRSGNTLLIRLGFFLYNLEWYILVCGRSFDSILDLKILSCFSLIYLSSLTYRNLTSNREDFCCYSRRLYSRTDHFFFISSLDKKNYNHYFRNIFVIYCTCQTDRWILVSFSKTNHFFNQSILQDWSGQYIWCH